MGYTISLERLLCCQVRMLLMEEEFLLELPGTSEGTLSFGEVQHEASYFCSTAPWTGEYGAYRCQHLGSLWMPFLGVYTQKGPDVTIDAWSMQRQGRNRLYVASSLCCDSPLPHSEGHNESPAWSLHLHPSLLMQCLIVPQSDLFPIKAFIGIRVGKGPVFLMLPLVLLQGP